MNIRKLALSAAAALALAIVGTTAAPSLAYRAYPTNHTQSTFNPKALVAGGMLEQDIGDLSATTWVAFTASNMMGVRQTALSVFTPGTSSYRSFMVYDGATTLVEFNPGDIDGSGDIYVNLAPGTNDTNITLDALAIKSVVIR